MCCVMRVKCLSHTFQKCQHTTWHLDTSDSVHETQRDRERHRQEAREREPATAPGVGNLATGSTVSSRRPGIHTCTHARRHASCHTAFPLAHGTLWTGKKTPLCVCVCMCVPSPTYAYLPNLASMHIPPTHPLTRPTHRPPRTG